jgi:DNA-binding IclR family transcriptional regulator
MSAGTLTAGLRLLQFVAEQPGPVGMKDVLGATDMTRATAFRVVSQLVDEGWLVAEGSPRRFSLGLKAVAMGLRRLSNDRVRHVIAPNLIGLATEAMRPAFFAYVENGLTWWLGVTEVVGERIIQSPVGEPSPALATASGRAILSCLDEESVRHAVAGGCVTLTPRTITAPDELLAHVRIARERGYSVVRDEVRIGLTSMAAPVRDAYGSPVAAIGLSELDPEDEERLSRQGESVVRWARRASIELGYMSPWSLG